MSERDMQDLLDIISRSLGKSWLDLVTWLRDHNALEEVDRRLAAGDMAGVVQAVQTAAERFAADINAAYTTSGQEAASWLDAKLPSPIRFDGSNANAVAWAESNKVSAVRGLTQESREVVTQVVSDGLRQGRNPLEVARDIRDSIGLAPSQADAVASYRRALEAGDYRNAIDRALSDGRTDRSLEAALRRGDLIDPGRIDGMVERYRQNMLTYRAETIARTEGLRALNAGTHEMFRQAIDGGDVDADSLLREWNHAGHGKNSRPGHVEMSGQQRKYGEKFHNPITGAELMFPGDPDAAAAEIANCRCVVSTRLVA